MTNNKKQEAPKSVRISDDTKLKLTLTKTLMGVSIDKVMSDALDLYIKENDIEEIHISLKKIEEMKKDK